MQENLRIRIFETNSWALGESAFLVTGGFGIASFSVCSEYPFPERPLEAEEDG